VGKYSKLSESLDSPCIDAGDPAFPLDPDGTIADMGAFYYDQTGINDNIIISNDIHLYQNFPNPFNPSTIISFTAEGAKNAELVIYNLKGQKIRFFTNYQLTSSPINQIVWNGTDENDQAVSSGVYFYKLNIDGKTKAMRKCLLLK
jgi:hypothetical protein